eukprot:2376783-Rhodomonas_salina.1
MCLGWPSQAREGEKEREREREREREGGRERERLKRGGGGRWGVKKGGEGQVQVNSAIRLRSSYAMSVPGANPAYEAVSSYAMSGTDLADYAICAYAVAMRCPCMGLPGEDAQHRGDPAVGGSFPPWEIISGISRYPAPIRVLFSLPSSYSVL